MYGQRPPFRPGGGGRGASQPPQPQQQQIQMNPNLFPNPNLFMLQQNPNLLPQFNPFLQNPNSYPQFQHQYQNMNIPVQLNHERTSYQAPPQNEYNYNSNSNSNSNNNNNFPQQHVKVQNEIAEKVEKAARSAWNDLLKSKENVSAWKVSQAALLAMKAESWESLGLPMQQVPSLKSILVTEGKINAFIHCFVAARKITSLYDLEVAVCESEGVKIFEELELGPLVKHPLAVHYFSLTSKVTEVYTIRTEEIISHLCEFIDTHNKKSIKVDIFLDFICKKQSASGWENLGVRVQDFRLYVNHIKHVKESEDVVLEKCYEKIRKQDGKRSKKRPLFSKQKKEMDDHFDTISQRLQSFSSEAQFSGKHIRFLSSSSEDDDSEANQCEDNQNQKNVDSSCNLSQPNGRAERVGSCPYPSAIEEMKRLGLKSEVESTSYTLSGGVRCDRDNNHSRGKRRYENLSSSTSLPRKLPKKEKFDADVKLRGSDDNNSLSGESLSIESLRTFVTTWNEACRDNNADVVLERMLQFYNVRRKRKVKEMFASYPFIGLLNAAVACMKLGLWDNMYDTFLNFGQQEIDNKQDESSDDYINIGVRSAKKDVAAPAPVIVTHKQNIAVEDIAKKISGYLEDDVLPRKSPEENRFRLLRKLCNCEYWLIEQYSVDKFESIGYGEYFVFLEKYSHLLPDALQKCILGGSSKNVSLEAHMLPIQLDVLLSQALDSFQENETVNIHYVSELLARQFPLVCFELGNSHIKENFLDVIQERRCNLTSHSVLFSTPLSRPAYMGNSSAEDEKDNAVKSGITAPVTSRDAIEVMLKAPMLADLKLWSHWDTLFAPHLGSIVKWLLKEVNSKELLCLVTKDGKVIRLDQSATVDSFLKVFIEESSFETAVQLLSLFAIYGGEQSIPLSLLKCHAQKAFEVVTNNYLEKILDNENSHMRGTQSFDQHIVGESTSSNLDRKFLNNRSIMNRAAPVLSRFVLECLSYLPVEFCSTVADILISGLQSFVNNAPAAILAECKQIEHRLILHEVGLSLGLLEWVNDYQSFCSSTTHGLPPTPSCLDVVNSEPNRLSMVGQGDLNVHVASSGEMLVSSEADLGKDKPASDVTDYANLLGCTSTYSEELSRPDNHNDTDPAKFIESIRQDEFGLNQCLSATESSMLEKQHARLGRALHCLSQELYSQDSHFILELVQNADDNIYPENVEPTLTFILEEKGIVVLNNEHGFSFNNIRALCDVGNSTKKGVNTGYIGKKGIGFKSVFRVTDAPEIHSNGFHIKFDITGGQIGFVLPTVIPPCDVDFYTRLALEGSDHLDRNSWKTCIVLPFRSSLLEGFGMNNILSMFSDLHPSLLLFLHRLQCIKFKNLVDDSFIVMRKEVIGNGIVEVTLGNNRMTWFVASKKLVADTIRSDAQTTEISVAFTLKETGEEGYAPVLNQQPVFSFLPLRTYGLKFILQGDFVLPSSREEVDGNSPWNQWLLSEFPDLFVSAVRSFCSLPCYENSPAKAITVFMSFVPLVGEVHGFFSSLPRRIISKLRMSNCLLLESNEEWVPPCKVMRNWSDQTRSLLSDSMLHEHLGLGFLNKDIVLSDSLAKALGVEDCGPTILLKFISSLCRSEDKLKSMGFGWLASWLSTIYVMPSQPFMQTSSSNETESNFISDLQKTPFIPLSDGKYSSLNEGIIWLHCDSVDQGISDQYLLETFPRLFAKLRIVNPGLLAAASTIDGSCSDASIMENAARMLYKIGVQRLCIHDIVKLQILPAIYDDKIAVGQEELMTEYLAFVMFHLQSSCTTCCLERDSIIAELHEKALILTNFGFKRCSEVAIHFNQEYGNSVDVDKLINGIDINWYKIGVAYVRHPITKSISGGVLKWRRFFQEIGVTDFVQVVAVCKSVPEMSPISFKYEEKATEMSVDSVANNWESQELFHIVSWISSRDDREKSGYLLEILDKLWDEYYSDKATGYHNDTTGERKSFKSSIVCTLQNIPWIASNISNKLHYPKDLFDDCVAVNSIFGRNAPCTIPKVKSTKLLTDIGLKTEVTLDDALSVLRLWRQSASHLNASVSQMSNFYAYLWKEMTHSKKKVIEELHSGPFIFVPDTCSYLNEDVLPGSLMSPRDVYWHDTIGSVDLIKSDHPECVSAFASSKIKMLQNLYPHLHDFFVNECGVDESPPFSSYLQILLELSAIALPHQAAKQVFEVFLIWDDALRSGSMTSQDVQFLKENLLKKEYAVLPTRQDKWVSLHSSFGIVCWSDDDNLRREFKHREGVDFLYFEKSTLRSQSDASGEDNQILLGKVSVAMQRLGIPVLSKIVTREAIAYGSEDSSSISLLVNWVLPYAQRYIFNAHPDKYFQLKQSSFENLKHLKIVVVEKLFYRYKIMKSDIASKKRHQCNCLLQENILYCCRESDSHSIFLELSCLLFDGTPELHFANFLHMIKTMAESGATEEQTESFILNSQKMPKLPDEESIWSLQSVSSLESDAACSDSVKVQDLSNLPSKRKHGIKSSNWPPANWKTAPGFESVDTSKLTKPWPSTVQIEAGNIAQEDYRTADICFNDVSSEFNIDVNSTTQGAVQVETEVPEPQSNLPSNLVPSNVNVVMDSIDLDSFDTKDVGPSVCSEKDPALSQQALLTGRLGELVAFKYFMGEEVGDRSVKWVNEANETGLPYDIVLEGDDSTTEYIEVKATRYGRKNWFLISLREWQFAIEKGESFSIAHVVLAENNMAKVTVYQNPARLCQLGNLRLAVVVPKQ
ncbi:protein NO VEIN isoform X1 [Salvia hispanica]|uniref:protein NO VEIN isoform X1 n=2 Tax=Salvia hispanica TaxID=49212 RepID=UPI00200940DF|nr:protein NO VEIN isoform X1 [Salvia hispanica]